MTDLTQQLLQYGEAVELRALTYTASSPESASPRSRRRGLGIMVAAVAAASLAIAGVAVGLARNNGSVSVNTDTNNPTEPSSDSSDLIVPPSTGVDGAAADTGDVGAFVYLTTDTQLTIVDFDAATVTVEEVPELAPGDPPYRIVDRGDQLAFYGQTDVEPAVFVLDPQQRPLIPKLLGEAWFFIPAAHDNRIWLAILDMSSPPTVRALAAVREVDIDGTIITDDVAPPDGRWPVAALSDGLLFQGDQILELWDPATEKFIDTLPGPFPVATWNNRLVSCGQCNEIHLIDIEEDTDRIVNTPPDIETINGYGGAFSPDGRYVAVIGYDTAGPITDETAVSVVLIDFVTGSARVVPDSRRTEWTNPQLAWTNESLFYADTGEIWVYFPLGDYILHRVGVEIGGPYYGMAAL